MAIEAFAIAVVTSETGVTAVPTFPVVRTFGPRTRPPNSALQCDNAANLRDSTRLFVFGHRKQNQPSNVSSAFTTLRVPGLLNLWEVGPTRPRAAAHRDHGDGHTALFPFRPDDERAQSSAACARTAAILTTCLDYIAHWSSAFAANICPQRLQKYERCHSSIRGARTLRSINPRAIHIDKEPKKPARPSTDESNTTQTRIRIGFAHAQRGGLASRANRPMPATVALFDVATERCGATDCDVPQRFLLASRERSAKRREISWTVDAKNIGQFQRRRRHRAGIWSG